jgi:hypothetical protein
MKILLIVLVLFSLQAMSQSPAILYFDNKLQTTTKKKAMFYGSGQMEGDFYKLSLYYLKKRNFLAYEGYFKDSTRLVNENGFIAYYDDGKVRQEGKYLLGKRDGLWTKYWPTGLVREEIIYNNGLAEKVTTFHDLPGISQSAVTVDDMVNNTFYYILYDGEGKKITEEKIPQNFSQLAVDPDQDAAFRKGPDDWRKYISRGMKIRSRELDREDFGTVLMRFVIDADGRTTDIKALSMQDSKLAEVASFVLQRSPQWKPAIHNGKNVGMVMFQLFSVGIPAPEADLIRKKKR